MKKEYISPEVDIIIIEEDVITASRMFGSEQPGDDSYAFDDLGFK